MLRDRLDHVFLIQAEPLGLHDQAFDLGTEQLRLLCATPDSRVATTLPTAGVVTRTPWATSAATTLWAVFGLILSSWLRTRTEGNLSRASTGLRLQPSSPQTGSGP